MFYFDCIHQSNDEVLSVASFLVSIQIFNIQQETIRLLYGEDVTNYKKGESIEDLGDNWQLTFKLNLL